MTQSTEQERAEFEAWLAPEYSREKWHTGEYTDDTVFSMFAAWQAARRAQVVPQGWKMVPEVLTPEMKRECMDSLMDGIDIYMNSNEQIEIQTDAPRRIWKFLLAAAPQPPEAEDLLKQLKTAQHSADFYKRRCELLQSVQSRMRDPERTLVCDVLANGQLLKNCKGELDETRYSPEAAPVQMPEAQAEVEVRSMKTYLDLSIHEWSDTLPDGCYKIYTDQQVRQLLAAHGIGKDKQG